MEKTYKILKLVILVLTLVVLLLAAARLYNALSTQVPMDSLAGGTQTEQRQMAPDFTVYDLEGNAHKLSDFQGMPVVLNFWASWCGPCKSEMPHFQAAYEEYGEDLHFLMVNMSIGFGDTRSDAQRILSDNGYTFPVYYDDKMECAYGYGVTGIPITVFIDKDGAMVSMKQGMISESDLQRRILTIIG